MQTSRETYVHALGYHWLDRLYDPLIRVSMREMAFKRRLVEQAGIQPGHRVLDLGCGTATLTLLAKQMHPEAVLTGLDGDPRILQIAAGKITRAGLDVQLDCGMSFDVPYPDGSFDRVLTCLMLHHLTRADKVRTLLEVLRTLQPGGELHIADWGKPASRWARVASRLVGKLDGVERLEDNLKGRLPILLQETGYVRVRQAGEFATILGTLSFCTGAKPQ